MAEQLSRYGVSHLNDFDLWKAFMETEAQYNAVAEEIKKRDLINKPFGEWSLVSPQNLEA